MVDPVRLPPIEYPGNVPGILYEPRAFWSVTQVNLEDNPTGRVVLSREDFRNGEKWPVTLTHLLVAPINYALRSFASGSPTDPGNYHLGAASVLNFARLLVSAPQRQGYARRVIPATAFTPRPRWEPRTNNPQAAALWNAVRWDFDHPMVMPRQGTLELQLSSVGYPAGLQSNVPEIDFSVIVNEGPPAGSNAPGTAGVWPGNARIHPRSPVFLGSPNRGWPGVFPADPVGNDPQPASPFATSIVWPPQMQLSAREYDSQNVTNAGSVPTTGFAVAIDQLGLDDVFDANTPVGGFVSGTPLSMRMAARARTRNGGTGHWWWRPGAPLALVTPTITPAQVYRLPTPITLAPGDTLEVELQAQRPVPFGEQTLDTLTTFGVSFTGSAAIEG